MKYNLFINQMDNKSIAFGSIVIIIFGSILFTIILVSLLSNQKSTDIQPNNPIDCVMDEWGPWSDCQRWNKIQRRNRIPLIQEQNGGESCGPLVERRSCMGHLLDKNIQVVDYNRYFITEELNGNMYILLTTNCNDSKCKYNIDSSGAIYQKLYNVNTYLSLDPNTNIITFTKDITPNILYYQDDNTIKNESRTKCIKYEPLSEPSILEKVVWTDNINECVKFFLS